MESEVIGLLVADLHLSERAPLARRGEVNWFSAQDRSLKQLRDLQVRFDCPVFVSGDIFDKPLPSVKVVNFAIDTLPMQCWGIPGQHDLLYHRWESWDSTAYGTLVRAKALRNIYPGKPIQVNHDLVIHGFPWGYDLRECDAGETDPSAVHLALVHAYCWRSGAGYPEADREKHIRSYPMRLAGYDVASFGDNHISHEKRFDTLLIYNNGSFLRRSIDQKDHRPSIGILRINGSVERFYLDTSEDVFEERKEVVLDCLRNGTDFRIREFLKELQGLEVESLDFLQAVRNYAAEETRPEVRELIGEILDACHI